MSWGLLPTKTILGSRFQVNSLSCSLCNSGQESIEHLFIECSFARIAWSLSPWPIRFDLISYNSIVDWVKAIINPTISLGINKDEEHKFIIQVAVLCDVLWMNRNEANHKSEPLEPRIVATQVGRVAANHFQAWDFKVFDKGRSEGWSPSTPP